eukprot:9792632-Prorocentrum_lima.AAC.1
MDFPLVRATTAAAREGAEYKKRLYRSAAITARDKLRSGSSHKAFRTGGSPRDWGFAPASFSLPTL